MSGYGAPRGSGGGRGRGRSRGGGRSGGGGGHHFGGGGGGGRGAGPPNQADARLKPCKAWTTTGTCSNGNNCKFAHVVKLHASIDASSILPNNYHNNNNRYNNNNNNTPTAPRPAAVSAIAIWETLGVIKIFTGSHDGFWRLWNTQDNKFVKEFEHDMGGKVNCLEVASNFLFCGFESVSPVLPNVRVGMIHCWNLASPADPPLEFQAQLQLVPYAHAMAVTKILVVGGDQVISGSQDGGIRVWRFDTTAAAAGVGGGGKGMFVLARRLLGHAREITGLVIVDGLLWSSSIDGSIRLWDLAQNGDCQYVITSTDGEVPQQNGAPQHHSGPRSNAFTDLLTFMTPAVGSFVLGSSLNQTVKAWNGSNGECVANESHGDGVVCMSLSTDLKGNPILLIGLEKGDVMVRNVLQTPNAPGFCLLFKLSLYYTAGHDGPVKAIREGPANTFYTVGTDGKLLIWQFTGDLGL